jgi:hypothetical protein
MSEPCRPYEGQQTQGTQPELATAKESRAILTNPGARLRLCREGGPGPTSGDAPLLFLFVCLLVSTYFAHVGFLVSLLLFDERQGKRLLSS